MQQPSSPLLIKASTKGSTTTIAPEFANLSPSFLKNYSYIYKECTIIVSPKDGLDASLYYSEKDA
jgi:hypothetical protein